MDKMSFASYKFKPSDVIEGLNRYFAETKANRYLRVPLEIKNGEVKPGNYYVIRNIVFGTSTPKVKEYGYYYLICDPEEVVGVAINWLREECDIFYRPGMNEPPIKDPDDIFCMENLKETKNFSITIDDFCVDDAAREYEKATRKDLIEALQKRLHDAKRRIVALEEGHKKKSEIIDQQKTVIKELEEQLREKANENSVLRSNLDYFADLAQSRQMTLSNVRYDILKVYREIFDCSNGDPEGTDEETMQDILTEYKRTLKLKDAAEEKTIKYKELARENEENLAREREWTKKMGHKLIEIQDICER